MLAFLPPLLSLLLSILAAAVIHTAAVLASVVRLCKMRETGSVERGKW